MIRNSKRPAVDGIYGWIILLLAVLWATAIFKIMGAILTNGLFIKKWQGRPRLLPLVPRPLHSLFFCFFVSLLFPLGVIIYRDLKKSSE
jgi:hypothetical protein